MYHIKSFLGNRYERINKIINHEYLLFNKSFNFIGSANYPFKSVLEALSHPITLNPAEGFPGKRYFPNCNNLDEIELYGMELLRNMLDVPIDLEISLQPHSGTQANHIVFNGILDKNDSVLVFRTDCGGHVSHSFFNSKYYKVLEYGINKNERIDYAEIDSLIKKHSPKLVIAGASSYPRKIDFKSISNSCKKTGALLLADISHTVIYHMCNHNESPLKYADFITFTTHKTTRGPRGGIIIFKKEHSKKIRKSIFPITQGAPKFNEILSKVLMAIELNEIDRRSYMNKILSYSQYFANFMLQKGVKVYTSGTDNHLVILNLENTGINGAQAEAKLEEINIFTNRNLIPYDKKPPRITSGLRFGFLVLSSLNFSKEDFVELTSIIYDQLFTKNERNVKNVIEIARKYPIINISNEEKLQE